MMALTMVQPYAWLFARGLLLVDDRAWGTARRGPLAIHAGKGFDSQYHAFAIERLFPQMPAADGFEHGGVVGVADLSDCLAPGGDLAGAEVWRRSHFGGKGTAMQGRWHGLVLSTAREVPFFKARGERGLFELPVAMDVLVSGRPTEKQ